MSSEVLLHVWYLLLPVVILYVVVKLFGSRWKTARAKFYASFLNNFAIKYNKQMATRKTKLFSELKSAQESLSRPLRILEIGAGSGANFQYYPAGADVVCVEPNRHFEQYLKNNLSLHSHVNLEELVVGSAEDMSGVESGSVDCVVSTLVLCTVADLDSSLAEIRRVLRTGGTFMFMEHVAAEERSWLAAAQNTLNTLWFTLIDNCNINRPTWRHIHEAGFTQVRLDKFSPDWLFCLMRPHISGIATK